MRDRHTRRLDPDDPYQHFIGNDPVSTCPLFSVRLHALPDSVASFCISKAMHTFVWCPDSRTRQAHGVPPRAQGPEYDEE